MTTAADTDFAALTGTYTFDVNHTRIGFVARHAMVTKVRGAFTDFEGTVTVDGKNPANSQAALTIQVASIDTRVEQRNQHLRTNDFLDVATYPTITFASTAVKHIAGDDFEVTGNLTIKDVTREVTIPLEYQGAATDPMGNHRVGFEGSVAIQRSDYGITYNAALETGGVLVSDKIVLELEISAIRN